MPDDAPYTRPAPTEQVQFCTIRDLLAEVRARSLASVIVLIVPDEDGKPDNCDTLIAWEGNRMTCLGAVTYAARKLTARIVEETE